MKRALLTLHFGLATLCLFAQSTLNRPNDPVILVGDDLTAYNSFACSDLVAFKNISGSWIQIPLQIDERELKDIVSGYGALAAGSGNPPSPSNPKILFYCDANTNIGADSSPLFDADDELVFMAKDAGGEFFGSGNPAGTVAGSCTQISITDSLGGIGYVYIYRQDGSLQQSAGLSYVTQTSNVQTVTGWPAHLNGLNIENTTISTSNYSWHISGEWISDELKLTLGTNVDILDRHKNFFANGFCGRSENTFSDAENAYLTVKAGPIRVIRSVMGANSGPLTQRTHFFYQGRFDIVTDLRVHSIPSVFDAFDYSPAANGMIYKNNINGATTAIINGLGVGDGISVTGTLAWEQITGSQGTLSILHRSFTDINSVASDNTTFSAYYDDNSATPLSTCTGDGQAWGTSGWGAVFTGGPTTDPIGDAGAPNLRYLKASRIAYPGTANQAATTASDYNTQYNSPFQVTTSACVSGSPLSATISATPILCANGTTTITVNASGGTGTIEYDWSHDNNLTGNIANNVPAGTYNVTVSDDNGSMILTISAIDGAPIDTSVIVGFTTITSNEDSATYVWINCNGNQVLPNETGQSLQVPENGTYAVIITNSNGCTDTSACIDMYPYGIHENPLAKFISVFPNPATDMAILSVNNDDIVDLSYVILDITGRIIVNKNITDKQTQIALNGLSKGVYIIKVKKAAEDIKALRIIKN